MAADTVKTNEDLKSHQLQVNTCLERAHEPDVVRGSNRAIEE